MSRDSVFAEVQVERDRQELLWGGAEHDDRHSLAQWIVILCQHLGLAGWDGSPEDACHLSEAARHYDPDRYRKQLVRVAAVAVAALEAFDRKEALKPTPAEVWWQRYCDGLGEPVLLLDREHHYHDQSATPCHTYAVALSRAGEWEKHNAVARLEPSREEAPLS